LTTTNKSLQVLDNFEGAMIGDYNIKDNNVFITLKKEKPTLGYRNKKFDYNLHFHFGLCNQSKGENEYNIFIGCYKEEKLHSRLPWLWISRNVDKEYRFTRNIVGATDFYGKYFFKIRLSPKEIIYISNFPPKRFSKLKREFQELSAKTNAKEVIIGKTVEKRRIKAYEYGNINEKPTILIVAGFHPPERDTVAIEAIMEKFLNNQWKDEILNSYSFSLIPVLNPDGFANAMQGSNINEINFHWRFFGNSLHDCPEAHSIWKYCVRVKPVVFFDFHAFTFQNNNARPYLIPEGYYIAKKSRQIQHYYNSKLKELCRNNYSKNEVILAPNLLATKLRNEFGTITVPKFHMHMKNGIEESKEMALNCLEIVLNGLSRYKVNNSREILIEPYGEIKTTINDKIRVKMLNFWYFYIISLLKKIIKK